MGPLLSKNSTNVRFSDRWWSLVSDWAVGDIGTPSFGELEPCPTCGEGAVARGGRCEQCALEHELFHRDDREGRLARR